MVAVVLGIVLGKGSSSSDASSGADAPTPTASTPSSSSSTSGKSGSVLTFEDGTKYTYHNDFGGDWAMDPKNPFGNGGKAQSWSPRVGSEEWQWGKDIVRGVNLGQVFRCPHIFICSWCVKQRVVRYSTFHTRGTKLTLWQLLSLLSYLPSTRNMLEMEPYVWSTNGHCPKPWALI